LSAVRCQFQEERMTLKVQVLLGLVLALEVINEVMDMMLEG
jgi:hypothetical protein